ncbi:MAG: ABC transporter permease [Coriobacteriia bacterium]|nr:ABC transporter permease [Coriobacteriia bacterium]
MHNALAVTIRILRQFAHDRRTLFMMVAAPVIALFLLNTIFGAPAYEPLILVESMPSDFTAALADAGATTEMADYNDAMVRLADANADAYVTTRDDALTVWVEGSDPSKTGAVVRAITQAQSKSLVSLELDIKPITLPGGIEIDIAKYLPIPELELPEPPEVRYIHGAADMHAFDYHGPVFIGVFIFFYVFVTSGISFLRERTGGTLERLMAMPLRRWELVLGYAQGFGLFVLVQSAIVVLASIYWVGFPNFGSIWLVLFIALSMALVSMLMGILVSEFASTELQMMQLLQIIVIPQILLSGILDLSQTPQWMQWLSRAFPVTYMTDGMRAVMLRGAGPGDVWLDLVVLWAFIVLLFGANVVALKKYRRI